ncbi:MAG: hypothetical protein K5905_17060 [Roseibium sp.]|uniref:hypothetical protein n=1 Tax=Roseibium sp. TaxID=1936156 RepID=UPI0026019BFA|nr:hypothetical protein [Roseibium sp.]MCV0427173.1 hypothetical protein [Roseibium sp.]
MTFKAVATVSVAFLSLTACAKGPDAIKPASIPLAAYTGQSCSNLSKELVLEKDRLEDLEDAQRSAQAGDAFGVFLIGIPISSATGGDKEGDLSVSKGKVQSIELAMKSKNCRTS